MSEMLIDVTRLLIRLIKRRLPTGVDRVCLAYVREYGASARGFLYKNGMGGVLPYSASQALFRLFLNPGRDFSRKAAWIVASSFSKPFNPQSFEQCFLLNIGHSGLEQAGYTEWIVKNRVKAVFMVHDLIPLTHPEYCRSREFKRHSTRMHTILKTAAGIVANSRETLQALRAFANSFELRMPAAIVAPLGGWSLPPPSGQHFLDDPYFVTLGTIEPRKNHWMLLQVWRRLVERHGTNAPKLVIIGQRGWKCENVFDLLDRCPSLHGSVIERNDCCDSVVAGYLRNARALIFPSFAEGYGLPLVEALSLGVPVVASALPVFREIAGDVPDYLDPLDGTGWLSCIEDYCLADSSARSAQLLRMPRFTAPTWEAHFKRMETLLETLRN